MGMLPWVWGHQCIYTYAVPTAFHPILHKAMATASLPVLYKVVSTASVPVPQQQRPHMAADAQEKTLQTLWPRLRAGGFYVIEDVLVGALPWDASHAKQAPAYVAPARRARCRRPAWAHVERTCSLS